MTKQDVGETPETTRVTEDDREVGRKVRELRLAHGLTQGQLAQMIGVTYQQMHKYERGTNRISVGTLIKIAAALGLQPRDFFESNGDPLPSEQQRLKLELSRVFDALPPCQRTALMTMARALLPQAGQAA